MSTSLFTKSTAFSGLKYLIVSVLEHNNVYRLSDIFHGWDKEAALPEKIQEDCKFKNTIAYDYLTNKRNEADLEVFKEVVKQHSKKYAKPCKSELVIHLRLGDIGWSEEVMIKYAKLKDHIKKHGIKTVSVVTALHFENINSPSTAQNKIESTEECISKRLELIESLLRLLKTFQIDVKIISNSNIDEDFCYMVNSHFFMKSARGRFSELVAKSLKDTAIIIF